MTARPLQRNSGANGVLTEFRRRHLRESAMEVAFACHLMTSARDLGNDLARLIRDPSDGEESRLGIVLVKQIQGSKGALFDPGIESIPISL